MDRMAEVVVNVTIRLKYDIVDENTTIAAYREMWGKMDRTDLWNELDGMLQNPTICAIEDFTVESVEEA